MANFETALERTLKFEGGYTRQPNETICGVDRKAFPDFGWWGEIDENPIYRTVKSANDLQSLVPNGPFIFASIKELYRVNFWLPIHGDEIESQEIANILFDFAVNSGVEDSVKALQEQLNETLFKSLKVDGIMGDKTLQAIPKDDHVHLSGIDVLFPRFQNARLLHICRWVAAKPERHKFLKGLAERAVKA